MIWEKSFAKEQEMGIGGLTYILTFCYYVFSFQNVW